MHIYNNSQQPTAEHMHVDHNIGISNNGENIVYTILPGNTDTAESENGNALDAQTLSVIKNTVETTINETMKNTVLPAIQNAITNALSTSIGRLVEEVRSLRREVTELKKKPKESKVPSIIPREPFSDFEEVMEFEKMLQNEADYLQFKKELKDQNKFSGAKYVRTIWRSIMTDQCAEKFAWKSTTNKQNISVLKMSMALHDVFIHEIGGKEEEYVSGTKTQFQYARNRQMQKQKKEATNHTCASTQ